MKLSHAARWLSLCALTAGCATAAPAAGPTTAPSGAAAQRPAGPQRIAKGQQLDLEIARGQVHVFTIDLQPNEAVHFAVDGQEVAPCTEWTWAWHAPDGQWQNGNPLPIEGAARHVEMDFRATVPIDEPRGGAWTFRVSAGEACERIRYRVAAR